jgi:hypothetical protein
MLQVYSQKRRIPMKPILLTLLLVFLAVGAAQAQTCRTDTILASTPTDRFTDNGDGTVTDEITGLMWKVCSEGQSYDGVGGSCDGSAASYTWQEALQQAGAVNTGGYAGHNDWRLPNQKELSSIVERQCVDPAINLEVFSATPSVWFWSASPYAGCSDRAWYVNFYGGGDFFSNLSSNGAVRLVRGGQ